MPLVDTNVLVYAYDPRDERKTSRAIEVLTQLEADERGVLSTQVLSEFYSTVTRKIPNPLDPSDARLTVSRLAERWEILPVTADVVQEGIRASIRYQLSYWDGLVWAAAKLNNVETILSEDFSHGQVIEGVRVVNPFLSERLP